MFNLSGKPTTYCFIDASNLFYGGVKKMGWKVDYLKLKEYLEEKYNVSKLFYYGGIETYNFEYDFTSTNNFPIKDFISHLENYLEEKKDTLSDYEIELLGRNIKRAKFYNKLKSFGYILKLKPVKHIRDEQGNLLKKANCDVDLTFEAMRQQGSFKRFVLLSGDGDFEILLKFFLEKGKEIVILSNPDNTAMRLKEKFHEFYKNFYEIRDSIEYFEEETED